MLAEILLIIYLKISIEIFVSKLSNKMWIYGLQNFLFFLFSIRNPEFRKHIAIFVISCCWKDFYNVRTVVIFHYYMTYYIELLCNNFHYQSVKTITDWLYPCSNEITDWEILNKHSWNNISGNLFFKSRSYGLSFYSHLTI